MLWLFNIFVLFLSPWIRIQKTPESGSKTLRGATLQKSVDPGLDLVEEGLGWARVEDPGLEEGAPLPWEHIQGTAVIRAQGARIAGLQQQQC